MKRRIALLLAMILCFSLEACSRKTEPVPGSTIIPETEAAERSNATAADETTDAT